MGEEARPWIVLGLALLGFVAAVWVFDRVMQAVSIRTRSDPADDANTPRAKAVRRSTAGAAFALRQVFDPGIEHVIRAEQDAQAEEDDSGRGEGDPDEAPGSLLDELVSCLGRTPIDPEEVRRALTDARQDGQDWRALYDEAVGVVLADRPYLAPALPTAARVAPRG